MTPVSFAQLWVPILLAAVCVFLACGFGSIPMGIRMGKPWSSVVKELPDTPIHSLLSAGIFGWLWPR